jgi:hypothetical protein
MIVPQKSAQPVATSHFLVVVCFADLMERQHVVLTLVISLCMIVRNIVPHSPPLRAPFAPATGTLTGSAAIPTAVAVATPIAPAAEVAGERRHVTVMFRDLVRLSSQLSDCVSDVRLTE